MPSQDMDTTQVEPVFILTKNLPDKIDIPGICRASERVSGTGSVCGAFVDGGLWRVYPRTAVGRAKLLADGITIGGKRVPTEAINPFLIRGTDKEHPATRLLVGPLSLSYSSEAIERNLERMGVRLRSKMQNENARLRDRTMTDWTTCRRFVWIDLPEVPLKEYVQMGPLRVKLHYREMQQQNTKCWNCGELGHRVLSEGESLFYL